MFKIIINRLCLFEKKYIYHQAYSTINNEKKKLSNEIIILDKKYRTDEWTNIGDNIIEKINKNLHIKKYHPLSHIRERIVNYFYKNYPNKWGNPEFSVYDNIKPIVTVEQNFDSLLTPKNHVSRNKSDCYYINRDLLLRAHTSSHQSELIGMGLNNFLVVGDVYRRDEIDATHYPVFHQVEGVRLCTKNEVFKNVQGSGIGLDIFEDNGKMNEQKQSIHSLEAVKIMEHELKTDLVGLIQVLFGKDIKYRWVDEYFPFTHPSWELEIFFNNKWMEVLGCGIIRDEILKNSGATDRIGWAFGLGLERLAMCLYSIPDIRLFWSQDSGFLHQFEFDDPNTNVKYKPVSVFPPIINDMSFWLSDNKFSSNDFYDLVKEIGGDIVEQVKLIDQFDHPKKGKTSHTYRIVYRDMERNLTQKEINIIHQKIGQASETELGVVLRIK